MTTRAEHLRMAVAAWCRRKRIPPPNKTSEWAIVPWLQEQFERERESDVARFLETCDPIVRLTVGFGEPSESPETACDAIPWSRRRVETLAARVEAGVELWHENDNRGEE